MENLRVKEIVKAVGGTLIYGEEDISVLTVSTNSKEISENGLFVPIIGEKVDAHNFIEDAFEHGAMVTFTSKRIQNFQKNKAYIMVEDTLKALQNLAIYYREKFDIPFIGITGSVGKTTTKEMIATLLEVKYNVLKTEGNMNSQVGVPLMILRLNQSHEIAVIEMGMSEEGEMEKLAKIVKPSIAVITNIGVSHMEMLGTRENIRKEKLNIINEFKDSAILFLNGNDILLKEIYEQKRLHKYTKNAQKCDIIEVSDSTLSKLENANIYAYGTEDFCEYGGSNIKTVGEETHFVYSNQHRLQEGGADSRAKSEEIKLGVLGIHNVFNALVALAIGEYFHISGKEVKKALLDYRPIAMRGQIKEYHGIKVIDDSYNASPDSMKSGISILLELPNVKRRIAVLADVLELGEMSYACHYEVGEFIAGKNLDLVLTVGEEAKAIVQAINHNNQCISTASFEHNEEAFNFLKEYLKVGDSILVKGSRGMHTEEIVEALKKL